MPESRVLLKNCEVIDPRDIGSFLKKDGFKALAKARNEMTPKKVIEEVKASGLRGRGGAGFPCGAKWELAARSKGDEASEVVVDVPGGAAHRRVGIRGRPGPGRGSFLLRMS